MPKFTKPTGRLFAKPLFAALACSACLSVNAGEIDRTDVPQAVIAFQESLQTFKDRAAELAMQAMGLVGIRYKFGGNTPESGMDCSGLVRYVFKEAWGKDLPRTSAEISKVGQRVETHELQPGDLVFYNTLRRTFSHVGIYLGDNKFIHSPARGGEVRVENMELAYWKKRFDGARRIAAPESGSPLVVPAAATTPAAVSAPFSSPFNQY